MVSLSFAALGTHFAHSLHSKRMMNQSRYWQNPHGGRRGVHGHGRGRKEPLNVDALLLRLLLGRHREGERTVSMSALT